MLCLGPQTTAFLAKREEEERRLTWESSQKPMRFLRHTRRRKPTWPRQGRSGTDGGGGKVILIYDFLKRASFQRRGGVEPVATSRQLLEKRGVIGCSRSGGEKATWYSLLRREKPPRVSCCKGPAFAIEDQKGEELSLQERTPYRPPVRRKAALES